MDDKSAMGTYLCRVPKCNAGNYIPGAMDPSGTAVNVIHVETNAQEYSTLYFAVYGWGTYMYTNIYDIGIRVKYL